jgi:hypothetical protein
MPHLKGIFMKHFTGLLVLFLVISSCQNQDKFGYVDRSVVINGYEKKLI